MPGKRWTDDKGTMHEVFSAAIFVGREHLGNFSFDPGDHPELYYRRLGAALFCPDCGDVWARLVLADSAGVQQPFDCFTVSCEKHLDSYEVAGSLLVESLRNLLALLPPPAVKREFGVHMRQMEKEIAG